MVGQVPRLIGLDGKTKMSKSLNNAIFLADTPEDVWQKVRNAVTDPARIHKTDPGHPEVCTIFEYHQIFNSSEVESIEQECRQGKIGCVECKKRQAQVLNRLLEPMHERRQQYQSRDMLTDILREGTQRARRVAQETMEEVREAMKIQYFK